MPHISTSDGTALYVKDWGQGRPAILNHGWPLSATGRAAAKAIAGPRLVEYDGAPHGVFATHRQQLLDDLVRFLA
jgi:pimeloyl-ACP methyl ester carboxylesterase